MVTLEGIMGFEGHAVFEPDASWRAVLDGDAMTEATFLVPMHLEPTMNLHADVFAVDALSGVCEWRVDGRR
jgi:hypothetical protein